MRRVRLHIELVHGIVGDKTEMLIEGHGRFNSTTAMEIGRGLENIPILDGLKNQLYQRI